MKVIGGVAVLLDFKRDLPLCLLCKHSWLKKKQTQTFREKEIFVVTT